MQFTPLGGFPSIIRKTDEGKKGEETKSIESRAFASTNIVNISEILKTKKQETKKLLGTQSEEEQSRVINMLYESPNDYKKIGMI
jgi:hypothetical protein